MKKPFIAAKVQSKTTNLLGVLFFLVTVHCSLINALAQTTEFTYQGNLQSGGSAASGNFDFEFRLYDALSGGTQIGTTLTRSSVAVAGGTFAVKLDFGGQFPGANRFLDITVRQTGGGAFTPLAPRQPVTSTPYAVTSLNATNAANATNATQLGGVPASQYVTTTGGGANFIQNTTTPQAASNFNVSGTGTANILSAATQFNIGGNRVLSNDGFKNLYAGVGAGTANTVGSGHAFFGVSAGRSNTIGDSNAFFGASAGEFNTTGGANAFFGTDAGKANASGIRNSFFGRSTGQSNTTGNENSFFGQFAGGSNTTGNSNSFFGQSAGGGNVTGSSNTLIGSGANVLDGNLLNATAIGAFAQVAASNSLVLGNGVKVGIGTSAPEQTLQVNGDSEILSTGAGAGFKFRRRGSTSPLDDFVWFADNFGTHFSRPSVGANLLTILPTGNVGIATSAPPAERLDVEGNGLFRGNLTVQGTLTANLPTGSANYIQNKTSQQVGNFNISGNGRINGSALIAGNLGVGTNTPNFSVHVVGQDVRVEGSNTTVLPRFSLNFTGGAADGKKWQNYAQTGSLIFSSLNDAENDQSIWQQVNRGTGTAISSVTFPNGKIGVGTVNPQYAIHVLGQNVRVENSDFPRFSLNNTAAIANEGRWQNYATGTGLVFSAINDAETSETAWLQVNRGAGTAISNVRIPNGVLSLGFFSTGGTFNICSNSSGSIGVCSSSIRYKNNIADFQPGLSLIKKLRPVTFNWKADNMADMGLVAEEVNAVEPLLTTTNKDGQIEGVKYDRVGVVLVNAVKEQQAQIESQQKQIETQRKQIEMLMKIVCSQNAEVCTAVDVPKQ